MSTKRRGPAMLAPFFIAIIMAASMTGATGCSDMLEDMGFEAEPERKAHTFSRFIPEPNDAITKGHLPPPEQQVDTTLSAGECFNITGQDTDEVIVIVERVIDGDTIRALNLKNSLRLWGIDAPEQDQPGGPQATEFLKRALAPGDIIMAQQTGTDIYGRPLVIISRKGLNNLNHLMVQQGWAFPYHGPGTGPGPNSCLESAQRFARTNQIGMWGMYEDGGVRPWVWRSRLKQQTPTG